MRKLMIVMLLIGAVAGGFLCGSYGWDQATELKDRLIQAFVYGFVSLVTLALHGLAIRVWVSGWRKSGGLIGAIAMLAFMMTAFTSLGGLASRSDHVLAHRRGVLDDKADTKLQIAVLIAERSELKFVRTTQAGVDAAQRAVDAAKLAREQECGKVGENCRRRQDAEGASLEKLTIAQMNKANTDRAIELDDELKKLRSHKTDGTVGSADPMKDLLSSIMGTWADVLSSWQKAAFAVVYDLCLVALMIGIEVLGHTPPAKTRSTDLSTNPESADASKLELSGAHTPVTSLPVLPVPARPMLIATSVNPTGSVPHSMTANLEAMPGSKVEIADIGRRYRELCKVQKRKPVSQDAFVSAVDIYCRKVGIRRRTIDGHVYLLDVQLTQNFGLVANAEDA